jgi:hypothetical protein
MSPRLLRPRASNNNVASDADARAYIEAVRLADGQYMEPAVQLAVNSFVAGCKADGIFAAIKASCLLMGARTLSGALTPLVGTAPTNANFVSGDYNRKNGLTGGSGKSLTTNRTQGADPLNDFHFAVLPTSFVGTSFQGVFNSVTEDRTFIYASGTGGTTLNFRGRSADYLSNNAGGSIAGSLLGLSRNNSADFALRRRNSTVTVTDASESLTVPNSSVIVFSGSSFNYLGSQCFYSQGTAVDLALLDSRVTALFNAIGAAIP